MIRFVDIKDQGTGSRFCFFDTIGDSFITIHGEQAWNNVDDFTELAKNHSLYSRCVSLCPDWAFSDEEDDIEGWYNK